MQLPEFQLRYVGSAVSFPDWKEKDLLLKQADGLSNCKLEWIIERTKMVEEKTEIVVESKTRICRTDIRNYGCQCKTIMLNVF